MLPSIDQDKANHFFYGALSGAVVSCLVLYIFVVRMRFVGADVFLGAGASAVLIACVFGALKEVLDHRTNEQAKDNGKAPSQHVEVADFLYTAGGGLMVGAPNLLLYLLARGVL